MKSFRFITHAALVAATLSTAQFVPGLAQAQAGCCMFRQDAGSPWVQTRANFDQCRAQNDARDRGDNIFEQRGSIWWNTRC